MIGGAGGKDWQVQTSLPLLLPLALPLFLFLFLFMIVWDDGVVNAFKVWELENQVR